MNLTTINLLHAAQDSHNFQHFIFFDVSSIRQQHLIKNNSPSNNAKNQDVCYVKFKYFSLIVLFYFYFNVIAP